MSTGDNARYDYQGPISEISTEADARCEYKGLMPTVATTETPALFMESFKL